MRILFLMRHPGYVRNFESLVDRLAERGHQVHLAFELSRYPVELAQALAARHASVTWDNAPRRTDAWGSLGRELRFGMDALRYRSALYRDAPKLTERAVARAPVVLRWVTTPRVMSRPRPLGALNRTLRRLDEAIPLDRGLHNFLSEQAPDLLLVTPMVNQPSQNDFVRGARRLGIPAVLCVASWDNLTNKGVISVPLDHVFVWNEPQRREAIELHGLPEERVTATGAHSYDHWFAWRPARRREAFCEQVGLPVDRPYVLYLCSSNFIAPTEPSFVRRWLKALRTSSGPLRDCGVLVRPHPQSGTWTDVDLRDLGPVAIWPRAGADPRGTSAKADYFDSMYHCAAAVGINTSAIVELSIIGRPAFTILDPDFSDTQQGTIHFAHLTNAGGGALTAAADFEEHLGQLEGAVGERDSARRAQGFLHEFIRPWGLDRPAAPIMAEAIEGVISQAPLAGRDSALGNAALRLLLGPVALAVLPWTKAARRSKKRKSLMIRRRVRRTRVAKLVRRQHRRLRRCVRRTRVAKLVRRQHRRLRRLRRRGASRRSRSTTSRGSQQAASR